MSTLFSWQHLTQSKSDIARSDFRGTFNGELIESPELTANALHLELHSYYSTLLELGLQRLLTSPRVVTTLLIELVAGEDSVISAKLYYLTPGCTLIVRDVLISAIKGMPISASTVMHYRSRINHGN